MPPDPLPNDKHHGGPPPELDPVTWADLIDPPPTSVLLITEAAGAEVDYWRENGARVEVRSGDKSITDPPGTFDVICLDRIGLTPDTRAALQRTLAPTGRVIIVADNRWHPFNRKGSEGRETPRHLVRSPRAGTRDWGRTESRTFGLLRSSSEATTAADLASPTALPAVVGASLIHVTGVRGLFLRVLARLPRKVLPWAFPAWLTILGGEPVAEEDRIIGKFSNRDSEEVKMVRGEPPASVERRYRHDPVLDSEMAVLAEVADAGFALSPRIIEPSHARSVRQSWISGDSLPVLELSADDVVTWTSRTAEVLADLQRRTRAADGSVIVHGDMWLGNVLVEGDRITAVVDWSESRRGSAHTDADFLVNSLAEHPEFSPDLRSRLTEAVREHVSAADAEAG